MRAQCPAPVSAIDVGTNTLRLLIGYVHEGKLLRIAQRRAITRVGKNILKSGKLDNEGIENSIRCLRSFKDTCNEYGSESILSVGTSALREAEDGAEFIKRVKESSGIEIKIISGDEEAELTLKGIFGTNSIRQSMNSVSSFVIDIGGGSTEYVKTYGSTNPLIKGSVPIGAVKYLDNFIAHDPPNDEEIAQIKEDIRREVMKSYSNTGITPGLSLSPVLIATGGTATTVAAMDLHMDEYDGDKIHGHKLSLQTLTFLLNGLLQMKLEQRREVKGLDPERADIIIPGVVILITLMEIIGAYEVIVSDYGLLEGIIIANSNTS
jgi:exopolyphosphatase/guanosine-5'-triphosphate,3'-diphosphate pyrophosphatase